MKTINCKGFKAKHEDNIQFITRVMKTNSMYQVIIFEAMQQYCTKMSQSKLPADSIICGEAYNRWNAEILTELKKHFDETNK